LAEGSPGTWLGRKKLPLSMTLAGYQVRDGAGAGLDDPPSVRKAHQIPPRALKLAPGVL